MREAGPQLQPSVETSKRSEGPRWSPEQAAHATHLVVAWNEDGYFQKTKEWLRQHPYDPEAQKRRAEYEQRLLLSDNARAWMSVRSAIAHDAARPALERKKIRQEVAAMRAELTRLQEERREQKKIEERIEELTQERTDLINNFFDSLEGAVESQWLRVGKRNRVREAIATYRRNTLKASNATLRKNELLAAMRFMGKYSVAFSGQESVATRIETIDSEIQYMRRTGKVVSRRIPVHEAIDAAIDRFERDLTASNVG